MADIEVLQASLRLRPPVPVRRHLDVAEAIEFSPHPGGIQPDRKVEDLQWLLVCIVHEIHRSFARMMRRIAAHNLSESHHCGRRNRGWL